MRRRFMSSTGPIDINKYLTIEALEDETTIWFNTDYEYCIDGSGEWKFQHGYYNSESINKGQTISMRSTFNTSHTRICRTNYKYFNLLGNCMSVVYGDYAHKYNEVPARIFEQMFSDAFVVSVADDFLPATTLADSCYSGMFEGCISLINAPELPATTLADYCYSGMFRGCTSLINAPSILPATTLAESCYVSMFNGCASLAAAPELPNVTPRVFFDLYDYMFSNCRELAFIKCLITEKALISWGMFTNWVQSVASSGVFVKHPNMTAFPTGVDGIPSGWTVIDDDGRQFIISSQKGGNDNNFNIAKYLKDKYPDATTNKREITPITEKIYYVDSDRDGHNTGWVVGISLGDFDGSEIVYIATSNWQSTYYKIGIFLQDGITSGRKPGDTYTYMYD